MGRKKIRIERIPDERNRMVTFTKRKNGLIKKAMELSVLCQCEIALVVFNESGKCFKYSSSDISSLLSRYASVAGTPHEVRDNDDYMDLVKKTKEVREEAEQLNLSLESPDLSYTSAQSAGAVSAASMLSSATTPSEPMPSAKRLKRAPSLSVLIPTDNQLGMHSQPTTIASTDSYMTPTIQELPPMQQAPVPQARLPMSAGRTYIPGQSILAELPPLTLPSPSSTVLSPHPLSPHGNPASWIPSPRSGQPPGRVGVGGIAPPFRMPPDGGNREELDTPRSRIVNAVVARRLFFPLTYFIDTVENRK